MDADASFMCESVADWENDLQPIFGPVNDLEVSVVGFTADHTEIDIFREHKAHDAARNSVFYR